MGWPWAGSIVMFSGGAGALRHQHAAAGMRVLVITAYNLLHVTFLFLLFLAALFGSFVLCPAQSALSATSLTCSVRDALPAAMLHDLVILVIQT